MIQRTETGWRDAFTSFFHPRVITMLFLGFSAGIPILLIFSTLSAWLREAEVARSAVTFFSWAALGYSFKFVWAPLVDRLPVPGLTAKLGQRRSWLLTAQIAIALSLLAMAAQDPIIGLTGMALAAVALGFSSATQDIIIDAYRIEAAHEDLQAMMSATYIAGYRIGMLVAGAGSLFLADALGSTREDYQYGAWALTYAAMAATMAVGMITTLVIPEPERRAGMQRPTETVAERFRFLLGFLLCAAAFAGIFFATGDIANAMSDGQGPVAAFLVQTLKLGVAVGGAVLLGWLLIRAGAAPGHMLRDGYVAPFKDFFGRYGKTALIILVLISTYRISDIVMGVVANVFYLDIGFTKTEIAEISKVYGLLATLFGGFVGGLISVRIGVMKTLWLGAFLAAVTNVLFAWLAVQGQADVTGLTVVVIADNMSAGIASVAFVAWLASLTNIEFTATQYALFSSLMTLFPKVLGGYAGGVVDTVGYPTFFIGTAVLGLPVLVLITWVGLAQRRQAEASKPG